MTYRFQLFFNAPRKGDPQFTPQWHIFATHGNINQKGFHAITPLDSIESEIDFRIDELVKELEEIRKKVKSKYKIWNEENR